MGRKTIELEVRAERAAPTEMAAPAEHRTSQRTQTSRHPGQPIAMSEKSSNFAPQFKKASHAHRTFIALPSHTHTRVVNKRTWCFVQMQVEF